IARLSRSGDAESRADAPRVRPVQLATLGIERVDRFGVPDDDLPRATCVDDRRRTIARLARTQGAPEFFSGALAKHHRHAALASDETNQLPAIEQRMARETPDGSFHLEVLLKIARPEHLSVRAIQAPEIPLRAQRIHFSTMDQRRGTRPSGVAHGVWAIVLV